MQTTFGPRYRPKKVQPSLLKAAGASIQDAAGPQLTLGPDQLFDSNGVRIRYVSIGQGESIIMIHGWAGASASLDEASIAAREVLNRRLPHLAKRRSRA